MIITCYEDDTEVRIKYWNVNFGWIFLNRWVTSVQITRGANLYEQVFGRFEAGTCQIVLHDGPTDPWRYPGLEPNQTLIVEARDLAGAPDHWHRLFDGKIRDINVTYDPLTAHTTTLTAFDKLYEIGRKEGFTHDGDDSFYWRLKRITDYALGGDNLPLVAGGIQTHAPKETPINALEAMNMAADGEAGLVWVDRHGIVNGVAQGEAHGDPQFVFNVHHHHKRALYRGLFRNIFGPEFDVDPLRHQCFTAIDAQYTTETTVNHLTINNIMQADLSGNDIVDELGPYTNNDSIAKYGEHAYTINTNIDRGTNDIAIGVLAQKVFLDHKDPHKHVRGISFTPEHVDAALFDIGQLVVVEFQGIEDEHMVTGLTHTITPAEGWNIDLELFTEYK